VTQGFLPLVEATDDNRCARQKAQTLRSQEWLRNSRP
jgi:hypothetical protein